MLHASSSSGSIYSCTECGANLNLNAANQFPPDLFFEAGNKGTLSFSAIDASKFRFEKEDKIMPFFETRNYWGIQRTRTKIKCNACGKLVGHVYDDGPPLMDGNGQFGLGPSQVIPRAARYRFKIKAFSAKRLMKMKGMKQIEQEAGNLCAKKKQVSSPSSPPPPPPPLPRFWAKNTVPESVTNREIARFWLRKRISEEEHLLAAIKAAAHIRARKLSEDDYKSFVESLNDEESDGKNSVNAAVGKNENSDEIRVGIKDWWTKSKYAYLNQPDMESKPPPKRRTSTYVPNCFAYKPTPLYPTSLGVF